MPKFAANLSMMFNEVPFLDRFALAAQAGFKGVEYLFPYEHPVQELAARLKSNALQNVLFNMPPGDWAAGERGLGALPGREAEFAAGLKQAISYATQLGCPRLHAMAGLLAQDADRGHCRETYLANLRLAAAETAKHDITLLIEPINTRDIPRYFLNTQAEAHALVAEVGAANLRVQMDLYHCQIVEGDLAMKIKRYISGVGHFQVAGVPERHEPDSGEINYPYLFRLIDELGYQGWIGCEYRPRGETVAGLGWLQNLPGN
jgi:hydroxypyruvate isomerase